MRRLVDDISSFGPAGDGSAKQPAASLLGTVRYIGLVAMSIGVATSSLTLNWIIEHDAAANFFPEFAGRVVYLSDVWLVLGVAIWATGWSLRPPRPLRLGPSYLVVPLVLLVTLTALSVLWAGDGTTAAFAAVRRLLLFGLYVALVNEVRRATVPVVGALFAVALVHAGVGLAQVIEGGTVGLTALGEIGPGTPHYTLVGRGGAYGLAFNPNPLGLFLAFASVSAYGLFLLGDFRRRSRALMLVPYGMTFMALVGTLSRAALVGCSAGLIVVTLLQWLWNRRARAATVVRATTAAVVAIVVFLAYPYLIPVESNRAGPESAEPVTSPELSEVETNGFTTGTPLEQFTSESVGTRAAVVEEGSESPTSPELSGGETDGSAAGTPLEQFTSESIRTRAAFVATEFQLNQPVIREHLWLGVGASNLPQVLAGRFEGTVFTPIHNVLLLLLAELGILGGVSWLLIMSGPFIWMFSRRHASGVDMHELLWLGPLVLLFLVGLMEFTPWATQDGRVLMMAALGLWAGGVSQAPQSSDEHPSGGTRPA